MTNTQKGYTHLFAGMTAVVVMFFLIDYGFQLFPEVSAPSAIFFGLLVALACVVPIQLLRPGGWHATRQICTQHPLLLPGISMGSCVAIMSWQWSFTRADPDIIALIGQSEMIFAFLLGVILLRERTSLREIITLGVALVGLYFVISAKDFAPLLVTIALLFSTAWMALQSFIIKRFTRGLDGFAFAVVRACMMCVILGLVMASLGWLTPLPLGAWPIFGAVQLIGSILWRMFYFSAHNYLPISTLYPFTILIPVAVLFISWVFLGIPVTMEKAVGAVLVIGGLFFFTREQLKATRQKS